MKEQILLHLSILLPSHAYVTLHADCDVDDEVDVGVVEVVGPARHLHEVVRHLDVLGVGVDVLRRRHRQQLHLVLAV
jgi:hypothetical protein